MSTPLMIPCSGLRKVLAVGPLHAWSVSFTSNGRATKSRLLLSFRSNLYSEVTGTMKLKYRVYGRESVYGGEDVYRCIE